MTDIHALLKLMVDKGASDLFLTCNAPPHLKIEGVTLSVNAPPLKRGEVKQVAYSIMTDRQTAAFEETMESNLSFSVEGVGRFRVNVYYQRGEVALVARLIKSDIPTFEQLGLPPACSTLAMFKRGLVLFVGAAGSGKSTSLAAMVGYRAANADGHILTIEDPIEFLFQHRQSLVDQREVGIDTRTFGDALRNALREAPDVIMIGEIRDQETAKHAIAYAETGHLCVSTMHANNANQAIERIINFFPEQAHKQVFMDLSLNLKGVISQRLLPSTSGRLALATEVLLLTPYVSDLVQKGRVDEIKDVMGKGNEIGMHTFDQSLYDLFVAGKVSLDNALRYADSSTDLALRIRLSEHHTASEASTLTVNEIKERHHTRK
ncbi:MAG: PilT/PilU family type 4a pilus ATPase [Nevskia sp.]|nr:PilT/PilU family type 4a pilus ATPase [Nevskia sp.]